MAVIPAAAISFGRGDVPERDWATIADGLVAGREGNANGGRCATGFVGATADMGRRMCLTYMVTCGILT